jgi:hypothetical protein
MKIKDLPEINRPREKLLKYGAEKLSDAELLAVLLRTGTQGMKKEVSFWRTRPSNFRPRFRRSRRGVYQIRQRAKI